MKVSVIMPTYNCATYVTQALESALNQTYTDFEIVVIDDGSTDDTKNVLKPYLENFKEKINYIYQENQGLANARNTGIKHAKGEYIALLDSDDIWLPQRLKRQMDVIELSPQTGLVHARTIRVNERGEVMYGAKRNKALLTGSVFDHLITFQANISCPTVLFRKSCCDKVGLFDPNLARLGCEDRDLWCRIAKEYRIEFIDEVLAHYRVLQNSMSKNLDKMIKARMYVVDKHCPADGQKKNLRRQAVSRIYKDLGDHFMFQDNLGESQKNYRQSIAYWPFDIWPWINLVKVSLRTKGNK